MTAVVARANEPWAWEPWEARRAAPPRRPPAEVREARLDARLLFLVVRARLAEGAVPVEHAQRLAAVAQDERVQVRKRRVAASLLARIRMAAVTGAAGGPARTRRPR